MTIGIEFLGADGRTALAGARRAEAAAATVDGAVEDVNTAKDGALAAIASDRSGALAAIDSAETSAVSTITGLGTLPTATVDGLGRKNLIADPRFTETTTAGYLSPLDSYFLFESGWIVENASGTNPYVDCKQFRKSASNYTLYIAVLMDNLGLIPGDVFRFGFELQQSGTATVKVFAQWRRRDGNGIGGNFDLLTAVTPGVAGAAYTPAVDLTVPAKGARLDVTFQTTDHLIVRSIWQHRGTVPARPVDARPIPDGMGRIQRLEAQALGRNNIALKRVDLSQSGTRTVTVDTTAIVLALSATTGGYGAVCTASLSPNPFNAVQLPLGLKWFTGSGYSPPSRIYVMVRAAGASENPATDGSLIAEGYIDVDPTSGSIGTEHVLLYSPATGAPITVTQSMLGTLYFIGYYGVTADRSPAFGIYNSQGVMAARDSTYNSGLAYQFAATNPRTNGWSTGDQPCALRQVMLTTPKEVYAASPGFAAQVAGYGDEVPTIIALPKKFWMIANNEQAIYYDNMLQRRLATTNVWATPNFSLPANGSGPQQERFVFKPTAAGTYPLTIGVYRGDNYSSSASTTFVVCAASAAAGTRKIHAIGDSLIANQATLTQLLALSAADGVTNIVCMGTQGSGATKFDAESGQSLGQFLTPTYRNGETNPFYNPTTHVFDYAYYLSSTSQTAPDVFIIEGGQVEPGAALSDSNAQISSSAWATTAETIIASVKATSPSTKIIVYTATAGPRDGQDGQLGQSYGPAWRSRRNWIELARKQIDQFSARESTDGVYVAATGVAIDPETGWLLGAPGPKNSSIVAGTTFATYAGMTTTAADGTLAYVTDITAWMVKVGGSGKGYWRTAGPQDGIVRRYTDTIHYSIGAAQIAAQLFALIKNIG